MQAVAARRNHDVLQEQAVVEPAPQLKPPVDGEDQADRRVEEDVIAAALLLHALLFALLDAEQAVKAPADGAAPAEIGLEELIRIIFPLTLFGAGAGFVVPQDRLEARILLRSGDDIDAPGMHVGAARRTACPTQQR